MAHQQESFLPFSSRQSLSCCLSLWQKEALQNLVVLSTLLQNRVVLFPISEPHGPLPFPSEPRGSLYLLQNRVAPYLLQSHMVSSLFTFGAVWSPPSPPKPCGPPYYSGAAWSLLYFRAAWPLLTLWLPGLGLNPSTHLPLQPHF